MSDFILLFLCLCVRGTCMNGELGGIIKTLAYSLLSTHTKPKASAHAEKLWRLHVELKKIATAHVSVSSSSVNTERSEATFCCVERNEKLR